MRQLIWDGVREDDEEEKRRVWRAARVAQDLWQIEQQMVGASSAMVGCTRLAFRPGWLAIMEYKPYGSEHKYAKPWYIVNENGIYVARVLADENGQID